MKIDEDRIIPVLVEPIVRLLAEFRNVELLHGAINLGNIFLQGADGQERFLLGECLSAAPSLRQHPVYETQTRAAAQPSGALRFEIQGTGAETRSFCHIDDLVAGVMTMRDKGEHLGIYHVGTMEEVSVAEVARRIATLAGRDIELVPGPLQAGGTMRRCPDISKLQTLGYKPGVPLDAGLKPTVDWYWRNADLASKR